MIAQTEGELQFGITDTPDGFTRLETSQPDGSAEPVIRELVQNCLDAADKAGRAAQVQFVVTDVRAEDVPGWDQYREAFQQVKKQRRATDVAASHDEKTIIECIDRQIKRSQIPVLLCIDNGCGITPQRMKSVLTSGNTDKGDGGAGSFGLGHYAAFGVSDLQYVVYGSRWDSTDIDGVVASGHAILATRLSEGGETISGEGFWRKSGYRGKLWIDGGEFPRRLPTILETHLPKSETGTVVGILGFNDFSRDEKKDPTVEEQIAQVVAANFSAAIDAGTLEVTIVNDKASGGPSTIDQNTLTSILEGNADRRQAPAQGQISGSKAWAAWLTLRDGRSLETSRSLTGVSIKWRYLDYASGESTRVHLFRKGMWITSTVDRLNKRDFGSTLPFDAVIRLTDGELEQLVRASEGPAHRSIDKKRLKKEQKKQLRTLLGEIQEALKAAVGDRSDVDEYIPESFAILHGDKERKAVRIPPRRKAPSNEGTQDVETDAEQDEPDDSDSDSDDDGQYQRPQPGKRPKYRYVLQSHGQAKTIEAAVRCDESINGDEHFSVRLVRASGADGTCEQPFPDDYLHLRSVVTDGGKECVESSDERGVQEFLLPARAGDRTLLIELAGASAEQAAADPSFLDLEIVKLPAKETVDVSSEEDHASAGEQ